MAKRIIRRAVVSVPEPKAVILDEQAKRKGLSFNTYCTMLLSEFAEVKGN